MKHQLLPKGSFGGLEGQGWSRRGTEQGRPLQTDLRRARVDLDCLHALRLLQQDGQAVPFPAGQRLRLCEGAASGNGLREAAADWQEAPPVPAHPYQQAGQSVTHVVGAFTSSAQTHPSSCFPSLPPDFQKEDGTL